MTAKKIASAKSDAVDVLNWDYLVKISDYVEVRGRSSDEALRGFAYAFTSTSDETVRNEMLRELLVNATANCSKQAAEEFVAWLSTALHSDVGKLRKFAKENGIRLKKG